MSCLDHDFTNCPAYIELAEGEHCKQPGCQRRKVIFQTAERLRDAPSGDLDDVVIPGKTGGRLGTI